MLRKILTPLLEPSLRRGTYYVFIYWSDQTSVYSEQLRGIFRLTTGSQLTNPTQSLNPPYVGPLPDSNPIRFGILGAANIAPLALIDPARNHPEAIVLAVAARDKNRAEAFAKKHKIPKNYGGNDAYQGIQLYIMHAFL
jgi:hypothetical protein